MEYKPFESGIEVNGQTVFSVVDGFGSFRRVAENFLSDVAIGSRDADGIYRIALDGWYSQEAWLGAFERVARDVGQAVLYDIGIKIPSNAKFPDWVVDVPSAIKSVNFAYHMNHRKGGRVMFDPTTGTMLQGIGQYGFEHVAGQKTIKSVCENPYPCAFDEGILTAMARRFDPRASVRHESGPCRREGANSCTYSVSFS
jgi:hypothetical protein